MIPRRQRNREQSRREQARRADEACYDGLLLGHCFWHERDDRQSRVEREPDTWDDDDFTDDDVEDMDAWH